MTLTLIERKDASVGLSFQADAEEALNTAQREYGDLPGQLADYRQALIHLAIKTWPELKEPYSKGSAPLQTDRMPMPQLVADAMDCFMEVIEENLSADARKALRILRGV